MKRIEKFNDFVKKYNQYISVHNRLVKKCRFDSTILDVKVIPMTTLYKFFKELILQDNTHLTDDNLISIIIYVLADKLKLDFEKTKLLHDELKDNIPNFLIIKKKISISLNNLLIVTNMVMKDTDVINNFIKFLNLLNISEIINKVDLYTTEHNIGLSDFTQIIGGKDQKVLKNIVNFISFKHDKILEKVINVDAFFVKDILETIKNKLIGKGFGNLEIEEILNDSFSNYDIIFNSGWGVPTDPDLLQLYLINANINIENQIEIIYSDQFYEIFNDDENWELFKKVIFRLVSHELVHKEQINKISINKTPYQFDQVMSKLSKNNPEQIRLYLSKPQELMAFAHEAYLEFSEIGYSDEKIKNRLREPLSNDIYPDKGESHIFWTYTEWFDPNEKPFQQFIKYMYSYLKENRKI